MNAILLMKRMIYWAALIITLSVVVSPAIAKGLVPEKISFQRILEKYDIATGSIEAITQDHQGFIWIGGDNGLLRYDGYELKRMAQLDNRGKPVRGVLSLLVDSNGFLWISTTTGLVRFDSTTETFMRYDTSDESTMKIADAMARAMVEIPTGELLLATAGGLTVIDPKTQTSRFILHDANNTQSLQSKSVWSVAVDRNGDAWVGMDGGVDKIVWASGEFIHYPSGVDGLTSGQVFSIEEDRRGDIWVGTARGLNRISPTTGKISQFLHDPANPHSLSVNNVRVIIEDSLGVLWIGTDQGGLNALNPETLQFRHFTFKSGATDSLNSNALFEDNNGDLWIGNYPSGVNYYNRTSITSSNYRTNPEDTHSLSHNSVLSFAADSDGNYWLGTDGGGLEFFNRKTNVFTHHTHSPNNPNSISGNAVLSTLIDAQGIVWAGTWGAGFNRFDPRSGQFTRYQQLTPMKPGKSQSQFLYSHHIRVIKEDHQGNLWLGTQEGGLSQFNRATQTFTHYLPDRNDKTAIQYNIVYSLLEDSKGRFWVGTQASLELMDRTRGTFQHFQKVEGDDTSLSSNKILSIYEDSKKRVWFGTPEGLNLLQPDGRSFRRYGVKDGFYDEVIQSIIEGPDGQLWLGTGNGISAFNPETGKVTNYYKNAGWQKGNFNPSAVATTRDGELLFGGDNGFSILNLSALETNTTVPPIVLTELKLFTDTIQIGAEDGLLHQAINNTREITLTHQQSMLSIGFAALNFRDPSKNEYAFRLRGFNDNWHHVGGQRYATYTNLDPGEYVFEVMGSNNDGIWNTQSKSINIRILPPWWQTWWAYALYTLSLAGLVLWMFLHQQYKRALVEEQNRKLIALDKLKDDFIANTSHELRTPLNGIIGLADSMLGGATGELSDLVTMNLRMISTSGKRLASLVNSVLDFSKLKNKHIHLDTKPTNLYEVAQTVVNMCLHTLSMTELKIINRISPSIHHVLADEARLQQILYNLIGNAIKFTESGSITLDAEKIGAMVWVRITDTGSGIPSDALDRIFNSFEQLEDHLDRTHSGTGLGLAITKQLVELHGGKIIVESLLGKGSCFSFCLPWSDSKADVMREPSDGADVQVSKVVNFLPSESIYDSNIFAAHDAHHSDSDHSAANGVVFSSPEENAKYRILVVDDNPINQQVLINQLIIQNYQFAVADDGPNALRLVDKEGPFDLILLDIMMPYMSGYEVCLRLREKYPMEELPIIFLTAKNTIADLVNGFEVGANDFLTKPISIGELNSRIQTHLQLLTVNRTMEQMVNTRTQEVMQAHNELKTLDEMAAIISQEIRLDRLLSLILNQVKTLFPKLDFVAYWKLNEETEQFQLAYTDDGHDEATVSHMYDRVMIEDEFIRNEFQIADGMYLIYHLDSAKVNRNDTGLPAAQSFLTMAFRQQEKLKSVLVFGSQQSNIAFHGMQPKHYERLRTHVDSALAKARLVEQLESQCLLLEEMSLTDQLTGLKNRRFLSKYVDHDISLLQRKNFKELRKELTETRTESDFIFFMMDLDHFKKTNDQYGQVCGDRVLAEIQRILTPLFRTSDYLIRWGGEEFLIVARFCDRANAPIKAEHLRLAIANHDFEIEPGKKISVTCSIGFACYPLCKARPNAFSWGQVIELADLALYAVKRNQRNGWFGFTGCEVSHDKSSFNHIMENPEREILAGNLFVATNLPDIKWK
jgi:two-component system, sensor histidine kinase ChiS